MKSTYRLLTATIIVFAILVWTWTTPHKTWQLVLLGISLLGFVSMTIGDLILRRR
ncbi:MAG: hypothetical protein JST14_08265 [Bacteroidetes bacterium]|nr:hypothetical protein [Bacteroidota bacterium]MBS1976288.1 hypothetical protein [Bacteroidota bacterium]